MTDTSTPPPPPGGAAPSVLDDALARLRGLGLRRDTGRRWFGGVCAGVAARVDVDPLLIRAAAIALTIAGGIGLPDLPRPLAAAAGPARPDPRRAGPARR